MAKYRKKPIVVECVVFNKEVWSRSIEKAKLCETYPMVLLDYKNREFFPVIETLEGNMIVSDGDYIIKGVNGEFYPCKPDIFEKTYDIVEENAE